MNMQMDAYLKKEQIGTLFVLVGAPEGEFRRGGGQGVPAQKSYVPIQGFFSGTSCFILFFAETQGREGCLKKEGFPLSTSQQSDKYSCKPRLQNRLFMLSLLSCIPLSTTTHTFIYYLLFYPPLT
jgi:hypothetical protein